VVPLTPADFKDDPTVALGAIVLSLEAEGWSPMAIPGNEMRTEDTRRLGVRILAVRQAGVLLYP
jgi:hypothetical protein